MRIAGMSSSSYFAGNLYASSKLGINTLSNTSYDSMFSGSSSLDYSTLLGNNYSSSTSKSNTPSLNDALTMTYQFSNTMKTSTMAMQTSQQSIQGFAAEAVSENTKNGKISSDTMDALYKSASTFAGSYSSSLNSAYYAPAYSSYVQGIEKDLRKAVESNTNDLKKFGFEISDDGALSVDEKKFKAAVAADPNGFKDLFSKTSNFTQTLNKANEQAGDTRAINKAEISLAVKENYMTYLNPTSTTQNSYSSMSYLFSKLVY